MVIIIRDDKKEKEMRLCCHSLATDITTLDVAVSIKVPYESPQWPMEIKFSSSSKVKTESLKHSFCQYKEWADGVFDKLRLELNGNGDIACNCNRKKSGQTEYVFDIANPQANCKLHLYIQSNQDILCQIFQQQTFKCSESTVSGIPMKNYSGEDNVNISWNNILTRQNGDSFSDLVLTNSSFEVKVSHMWMFEEDRINYAGKWFPQLKAGRISNLEFCDGEGINISFERRKHNLYMSGYISDLNGENWDKMDFYDIKVASLIIGGSTVP